MECRTATSIISNIGGGNLAISDFWGGLVPSKSIGYTVACFQQYA